jgi:two-component system sensor histidine kinase YesM
VVGTSSHRGNFNLVALIPDRRILENLPYLQKLIWIMTIGVLIFIPVGLAYMSRALLHPLKRMLGVMSRVKGGDWSVRIQSEKDAEEFKVLARSFNDMMNEIQTLRVNVFEEQLNKQREELQRLQLQVNPHFFLNSLNIVYNLAKVRNYQLIKEMSMALIQYFRYLFRSNTSFVKVEDELEHTRNYLSIQSLRFPDKLTWDIRCPEYLRDLSIPPLVIQTFVENSIKYALTMEEPIHIDVHLTFLEEAERSRMKITIKDNGRGFDPTVLRELQSGRSVETERGERTGIWNVQRRLKLLFKEDVDMVFANDLETGGAVVELILPIHPRMEVTT